MSRDNYSFTRAPSPWYSGNFVDEDLGEYYQNMTEDDHVSGNHDIMLAHLSEYVASRVLWMYGSPLIIVVGTVGSVLSLLVLCRKSMRTKTTMFYLASLAVADLMCIYTGLVRLWLEHAHHVYIRLYSNASCKLHTFIVYVSLDFSAWILVAVSIDRCLFITWPHRAKVWCTIRRARISVVILASGALLLNLHFLWTYQLEGDSGKHIYSNGGEKCYADTSSVLTVRFIENVWPWVDLCVYCLFPFVLMLTCDIIIIKQLIQSERVLDSYKKRIFFLKRAKSRFKSSSSGGHHRPSYEVKHSRPLREHTGSDVYSPVHRTSVAPVTPLTRGQDAAIVSEPGLFDRCASPSLQRLNLETPVYFITPPVFGDEASDNVEGADVHFDTSYDNASDASGNVASDLQTLQPIGIRFSNSRFSTKSFDTIQLISVNSQDSSIKLSTAFDADNIFHRDNCNKTIGPITIPRNHTNSELRSKVISSSTLSPSNVLTSFAFGADEDAVLLEAEVKAVKKLQSWHPFSSKVHPMKTERHLTKVNTLASDTSGVQHKNMLHNTDDNQCKKKSGHEGELAYTENATSANTSDESLGRQKNTRILRIKDYRDRRASEEMMSQRSDEMSVKKNSVTSDGQPVPRRPTSSVSKTLLAITTTFCALNAPIVIFIVGYTYWSRDVDEVKLARLFLAWAVVNDLQYLNNSIHFFMYCLTAPRFRQELAALVRSALKYLRIMST